MISRYGIYTLKAVYVHLIYMKKFLDCDWLREMQFFGNTAQRKGNLYISAKKNNKLDILIR